MILAKRERYIAVAAMAALALLVLDPYLLTPFLERQAKLKVERQDLIGEMERAASLFARKRLMGRRWDGMVAGGLRTDPAEAESQVLHAVRDWAQEVGLAVSSVKPERVTRGGDLREIMFQTAGTGTMSAVAGFLWRIETTPLALRVQEVQLGSLRAGTDDLSLQLRFSTLYLAAE